jgi:UDP-glucose 4-epimerase
MPDSFGSVYITGGTGFVGRHLRSALNAEDLPVTVLARSGSQLEAFSNETIERGDITEPSTLSPINQDVVIHLAAQTSLRRALESPRHTWAVNADGTLNVLEKARAGVPDRFIYVSSASVYGQPNYLPIDEGHPTQPVDPYGASKLAGEALVRSYATSYGLDTISVRLFNAYGPGQAEHNVIPSIVSQAQSGERIELGNLSPSRDFIYIEDVIAALRTVIEAGKSGTVYNVARGESVAVGDVARMVINELDRDLEVKSTTDRQRSSDIEIPDHVADISTMAALGWQPELQVRDGIQRMLETNIT